MNFYVYLIISRRINKFISYVGYTKDLKGRIKLHNKSKGAKFTRGNKWILVYFKCFSTKSKAMKEEYKLKKNYKLRSKIKNNYLQNENFNSTAV